jgi:hypothetical protein
VAWVQLGEAAVRAPVGESVTQHSAESSGLIRILVLHGQFLRRDLVREPCVDLATPLQRCRASVGALRDGAASCEEGVADWRIPSLCRAMDAFSPATQHWFSQNFAGPTDAQAAGWPVIAAGSNVLITAPTGSGKTLAAFLWSIDRLMGVEGQRSRGEGREGAGSDSSARGRDDERAAGTRGALHLAAEGAGLRHRAQPACAAGRHLGGGRRARCGAPAAAGGDPHRRYLGAGAGSSSSRSRRRSW